MSKKVRLGDVFEFKNGRAFKKSEWSQSGLPIIRIQNLNNKNASFNYFSGDYDQRIEVNEGDLLFSWSGTVGSSFGPHIWNGPKGVLNQHIFRIVTKDGVDKRYAYYALLEITSEIEKSVSGAVGIVHVTQSNLKEFQIAMPPLPEQKCLVAILDEAFAGVDAAIANAEKNLANARELFETILDSAFAKPEQEKVFLEEALVAQPRNGWSPPAKNHAQSGTPVLTLSSVTGFRFRSVKVKYTSAKVDFSRHYWVENGDLLITRSNTPELVGHVAIVSGLDVETIYPDLIMKMRVDPNKAVTKYIYYQLRTRALRKEIMARAQGANPTMKKVGKRAVQTLPIILPPLSAQSTIISRVESIGDECESLRSIYEHKLRDLIELKQSLLQKAFSGKLTADVAEKEVDEAVA